MAALNFPSSPQTNEEYTGDNGTIYKYDGVKWVSLLASGGTPSGIANNGHSIQVDSSGRLVLPSYTLPVTTGTTGQVLKWPSSGSTLEWADAGNPSQLTNGPYTVALVSDGSITIPSGDHNTQSAGQILSGNESSFINLDVQFGTSELGGIRIGTSSATPVDIVTHWGEGTTKQWRFGTDGYLTGESLNLQGYLKGVDGSTGSTGQVLTRQSNGGVAWANATGGSADTGDWTFSTITARTPNNSDLALQTVSTASQRTYSYWVAEYGGYGNRVGDSVEFGTGALYDSQGNLYVIGTAETSVNGSSVTDSLMIKYDPLGNLVWHRTWHDSAGYNCGATNVAIARDSTDRIYWIANNWVAGGCWFGYMDTDGNLGLGGTAQEVLGFSSVQPSDLACDDTYAYIAGDQYVDSYGQRIPFVAKVNGSTGDVVWAHCLQTQTINGDPCAGIYRAVTVNPGNGDVYAIGDYNDADGVWAMLSKWNSSGAQQWTKKLVTSITDRGEAVVFNNGYVYTVVNDGAETKAVVSKFNTSGDLQWAASLGAGAGSGYDLSFDASHNVYLTGILEGNVWVTKLNPSTGAMVHSTGLASQQGAWVGDGTNGDSFYGHRVGDIFNNRIAVTASTQNDLTQGGSVLPRVIVAQLPVDGSVTGTFGQINITDITGDVANTVGTYSLTTEDWSTLDVSSDLSTSSTLSTSNVTEVAGLTSQTVTLAAGPVVGTITTPHNWTFTSTGALVLPEGGTIKAVSNGTVRIKAGDEKSYWWSEFGDLQFDNRNDWGSSVEYDSEGNVYVAGGTRHALNNSGSAYQCLLIKYSPTGELLWQKLLNDGENPYTSCEGLWIDSDDNLYIIIYNDDSPISFLVKLDSDGIITWQVEISDAGYVGVIDIDGDNHGHVYIVGYQASVDNRSVPWVASYNTSDGSCRWQKVVDHTDASQWGQTGYGVAVDSTGTNVYLTGQSYVNNNWNTVLTSLSASDGSLRWTNQLTRNDNASNNSLDVAVDPLGYIYTVGNSWGAAEIAKWNQEGQLQWAKTIDKNSGTGFTSLDFDSEGYLYITGTTGLTDLSTQSTWIVIKMNSQGSILWQNAWGGRTGGETQQYWNYGHKEIAVKNGSLVITGYTHQGTSATPTPGVLNNTNILVIQVPTDGTLLGNFGPFFYNPTNFATADSVPTVNSLSATVTTTTFTNTIITRLSTVTNDEAADTHTLTGDTWQFNTRGQIVLPPGGDIIDGGSRQSVLLKNGAVRYYLDHDGVLKDSAGNRSVTGELSRKTDSSGNNFDNVPIQIKNATGYKRLVSLTTTAQTWLSLSDVGDSIGINSNWINGMVIDYQVLSTGLGYHGSMTGQIIIASNENYAMNVTHSEAAITKSNSISDVVFTNLDLWHVSNGTLQAKRTDSQTGQQLDIIWTAKVFINASENWC